MGTIQVKVGMRKEQLVQEVSARPVEGLSNWWVLKGKTQSGTLVQVQLHRDVVVNLLSTVIVTDGIARERSPCPT
jgi:hypothetical protein